jgi:hypothetical protein
MDYKKDVQQDDIVDNVIGFGVSVGFFFLIAAIFTVVSIFQG